MRYPNELFIIIKTMENMESLHKALKTANATFRQAVSESFTFRLQTRIASIPRAVGNKKAAEGGFFPPGKRS